MAFFLMPERLPKTRARSAAVMRGAESFAGPKRRAQSLAVGEVGTFAVCFIVCERGERERRVGARVGRLPMRDDECVGFPFDEVVDARWAYRGRSAASEISRPNAHVMCLVPRIDHAHNGMSLTCILHITTAIQDTESCRNELAEGLHGRAWICVESY